MARDGSVGATSSSLRTPSRYLHRPSTLRVPLKLCATLQVRLLFVDGSRIVFRLSGTGSVRAPLARGPVGRSAVFFPRPQRAKPQRATPAVAIAALTAEISRLLCHADHATRNRMQVGATVRMYIEKYSPPGDEAALAMETADALAPLIALGLELSQVRCRCDPPTAKTTQWDPMRRRLFMALTLAGAAAHWTHCAHRHHLRPSSGRSLVFTVPQQPDRSGASHDDQPVWHILQWSSQPPSVAQWTARFPHPFVRPNLGASP